MARTEASSYLTEAELCARLRVSRDVAHRLRNDPKDPIPCIRVGRTFLYDPKAVEAWAARRAEQSRSRP